MFDPREFAGTLSRGCHDAAVRTPPEPVSDPADPRLRGYVGLTDAALRAGMERDDPVFVVEGHTALARAARSTYRVRSVLCLPGRVERVTEALRGTAADAVPVYVGTRELLAATAGFDVHRGVLALAERGSPSPMSALDAARTLVVLEGVNDQENLGVIARTAAGLGADGLLLDPTTADPLGRRAVRVSMGEMLHLPLVRARSWPDALDDLSTAGWRIVALTPAADAAPLRDSHRLDGERVALLLGAEGAGLSDAAMARADRVRIPLRGDVDSLNVGHAAAIALWHLLGA